jgi:hypothetical protein
VFTKKQPTSIPLFDPRGAFGDPDAEETKQWKRDNLPQRKPDDITGMVRGEGPSTSVAAAKILVRGVTALQRRVLDAFKQRGPMTDEELERLPEFSEYGPTTVHKRRTELYQAGKVERYSMKPNSRGVTMIIWNIKKEEV